MKLLHILILFVPILMLISGCVEDVSDSMGDSSKRVSGVVQRPMETLDEVNTNSIKEESKAKKEFPPKEPQYKDVDSCIEYWNVELSDGETYIQSNKIYVFFVEGVTYEDALVALEKIGITDITPYHIFKDVFEMGDKQIIKNFVNGGMAYVMSEGGKEIETSCEISLLDEVQGAAPDTMSKEFDKFVKGK